MTEAFPWDTAPRFLLRDRDASYRPIFRKRVEAMGITEVVIAPRSPWQNAYVERVIGSIRRECLDESSSSTSVISAAFFHHTLTITTGPGSSFTGQRLSALASDPAAAERTNHRRSPSRGLHHRYERLAA